MAKDVKVVGKKEKKLTVAKVFIMEATKGAKSREDLAEKIISNMASKGVLENVKGKAIEKPKVQQQISAMLRDINNARGKDKGSWWSKYNVVEDKTQVKIVAK